MLDWTLSYIYSGSRHRVSTAAQQRPEVVHAAPLLVCSSSTALAWASQQSPSLCLGMDARGWRRSCSPRRFGTAVLGLFYLVAQIQCQGLIWYLGYHCAFAMNSMSQ